MNLLEDKNNPLWKSKNVIYCYTNKINGKKYVGQTIKTLKQRYSDHISESYNEKRCGYNTHFHKAIRKYGIKNFSLEILHIADKYSLDLLEIYYIEKWNLLDRNFGYNSAIGGMSGNRFINKTDEEMKEIGRKISETKIGDKNHNYGKDLSGKSNPMYGRHLSRETKEKMSKQRQGKNHPMAKRVAQYDLNGNLIKIWDYAKQISKELGINYITLNDYLNDRRKTHEYKGYIWRYYNE